MSDTRGPGYCLTCPSVGKFTRKVTQLIQSSCVPVVDMSTTYI